MTMMKLKKTTTKKYNQMSKRNETAVKSQELDVFTGTKTDENENSWIFSLGSKREINQNEIDVA